ncbi:tryptophan synthase, beta subunit [Mycobacterium ulcerans str. Harvey]|uniref:tryptophan synthase n=1 Tax=Mycobacterium ulcerans str. Harvey TaxID=1299332 RepID=A0ABP3ALS4_MYCUL|nr:tryptophan synthase, beta subunit [Mycobacterium ulcerans str. Harvey]
MADLSRPDLPRTSSAIAERTSHDPDSGGHFGAYGGRYVPEALMAVIEEVAVAYEKERVNQDFLDTLDRLQTHYAGRPSPLYEATRLSEHAGSARIFLKREDLNHTGSHKINNVLGQALLARRMGKTRVIAETGAGQHGVATATACALLGLECVIYMGAVDTARQALNVARMRLLGAEVVAVETGSKTLKDAINEAFRDWVTNADRTYYCFGTAAGPIPSRPWFAIFSGSSAWRLVCRSKVRRASCLMRSWHASVEGPMQSGSFMHFSTIPMFDWWDLRRQATASRRVGTRRRLPVVRPERSRAPSPTCCRTKTVKPSNPIRSQRVWTIRGRPEHAWLKDIGRVTYQPITDSEAMEAFGLLCRMEGIIPAIESAHAVAGALKLGRELGKGAVIVVNLSGRGDKDVETAAKWFGLLTPGGSANKSV